MNKNDVVTWNRLASVGNNPIARLTIVAPIIAPIALYSERLAALIDQYFDFAISLHGLPWLYVSLICLSIAQWLYIFFAPRAPKGYSSRAEYAGHGMPEYSGEQWLPVVAKIVVN